MSSNGSVGSLIGGQSGTVTLPKDGLEADGRVDPDTGEVEGATVKAKRESENTYTVTILDV